MRPPIIGEDERHDLDDIEIPRTFDNLALTKARPRLRKAPRGLTLETIPAGAIVRLRLPPDIAKVRLKARSAASAIGSIPRASGFLSQPQATVLQRLTLDPQ